VGHAGTLDPLATGLLVVVLGKATRLSAYLMESPKTYLAEIVLGATTLTDDAEAPMIEYRDPGEVSEERIRLCLEDFKGRIEQIPPAYSAVKRDGKRLYRLARAANAARRDAGQTGGSRHLAGEGVAPLAPKDASRTVQVHEIALQAWRPPRLRLLIRCGPGTYIRSIARDLGAELGVGGYLHALRRIASGAFRVEDAHSMERLEGMDLRSVVEPLDRAVIDWPAVVVDEEGSKRIRDGRDVPMDVVHGDRIRVYNREGALIALAMASAARLQPFRVFRTGDDADRP
jgi:tRNA pseudouridine55 synthase